MSILTKQKQILHRFFHFSKQLTILDQSSNGNSLISKLRFFMPLASQTSKLLSLCHEWASGRASERASGPISRSSKSQCVWRLQLQFGLNASAMRLSKSIFLKFGHDFRSNLLVNDTYLPLIHVYIWRPADFDQMLIDKMLVNWRWTLSPSSGTCLQPSLSRQNDREWAHLDS